MSNPMSSVEPWSLVAEGYAKNTQQFLSEFSLEAARRIAPGPNDVILDVAAGPGTLAIPLSRSVKTIHAIDFSEKMIEHLKAAISETHSHNVIAEVMDGQNLRFPENGFDAAFSMFGLMFFPDKAKGFSEIYRVLKPGKRAAVSSWAPVSRSPLMQLLFGALRAANPEIPPPQTNPASLENPDFFREQFVLAGFTEIEIVPFSHSMEVIGAEEFLETMIEGNAPLQWMKRNMDETTWIEKKEIMLSHLRKNLSDLPVSLSSEAYLGIAKKP
ncbi:class I SAM-dependent methyltransferase [Leptospira gomenensis]|uniref:Class I SAM-dependent methyltransferase n=1 Tax=Leptospira gomenensis TaxID=2484974 RepID=A0A5F1Y7C3_9LEPT|nr:class I SAM-dependent methyltransferase [Leptospira gomenensis]TGK29443.1 class I SAM-dependent methyltransferase [Leptospira gomenensis]TGK33654.1 class I SAM-dependent methyltransferase [Leptospira gomenensis]TGK44895.1 class I SAM-dependent methyltransferase [Leptospira gomenensis]TGK64516.1 class I SAM-dependent methyltransferase [Leptospira gomenensis]